MISYISICIYLNKSHKKYLNQTYKFLGCCIFSYHGLCLKNNILLSLVINEIILYLYWPK